jgi:hypothetical protein
MEFVTLQPGCVCEAQSGRPLGAEETAHTLTLFLTEAQHAAWKSVKL